MHLLYLDESGSVANSAEDFFVLAGVSVFERKAHFLEDELNAIAARFDPQNPHGVELHGSPMRSGKNAWRRVSREDRTQAMEDALDVVVGHHPQGVRLFGGAVRKTGIPGEDPVEHLFEQLCSRFDLFLKRCYARHGDPQRGLILLDKSSTEQGIQSLARDFKHYGHAWGKTYNYAEVPVFLDSRASRLIQLADLVAHAIYRHHERGDSALFNRISHCFDSQGPTRHGYYVRD
ncbi:MULTISPECIES: DUF3800 domain-containing protein [unclassified Thioalkalivibrio]|uniref:DUF3800 domain-containing protein n=1 Tax=unclassified Thioalkalivibrio TaxID=2621013 RepID=UPI0003A35A9B|nr:MULTISPECIES: DUF3800 domain-containing protein [unclassified Thioalkalivibrio]